MGEFCLFRINIPFFVFLFVFGKNTNSSQKIRIYFPVVENCVATIGVCVFRCANFGWRAFVFSPGKIKNEREEKMKVLKSIIAILLCFAAVFSMISCERDKYHEYDPAYYEINQSNYKKYFDLSINTETRVFDQAQEYHWISVDIKGKKDGGYLDCEITIEFTTNESTKTQTFKPNEEGATGATVEVYFDMTYELEVDYKVISVSGVYFDVGYEYEDKWLVAEYEYIKYNNIRYEILSNWLTGSEKVEHWHPIYKNKNNTKTLYFTDTIYTKSGFPVKYSGYRIFSSIDASKDEYTKVETFIFDGALTISDINDMSWDNVHNIFPNLKTVYIKNIVDDGANIACKMKLPTSGVTFYIGGDTERFEEYLSNVNFVNSINSAEQFNVNAYEQDNKR